ncbi:MAG: tetratricopeptide repeat protein [bacterium]
MTSKKHAAVLLLLAGALGGPSGAAAEVRSVAKIRGQLGTIEGQLGHYLSTIKPPTRRLNQKQLLKRLIDGMVLYRMKDYSRAAIVLMDIATRYTNTPEAGEAMFFLADSMFQQREFVVARTYFSKVVASGSSNKYYQLSLQRLLELEMRRAAVLGRSQTADPVRMGQVEDLLRKIQAIPATRRESSVEYVRGKYLFFRNRITDALTVFAGIGASHPYYLQAVYFTGVCHIKLNRLNAAAAVYKQLIDKVLFGYYRPQTVTQRRILQLLIIAAARLAYYKGRTKSVELAIELYNAIPRKSPYFDDALYERAWAYLKAKRYERAVKTLELLQVSNPSYGKSDEARVLLGNLKIRTGDFAGAKDVFRTASRELRPVYRKLRGLQTSQIDPQTIFDQLTASNLERFDIKIRLPKLALRWLRKQPDVKRALMMLGDLDAVRKMIKESYQVIRQVERKLRSGSQIAAYPTLSVARARAADLEAQILGLRGDLSAHLQRLLWPNASVSERHQLKLLEKERLALEDLLKKAPQSTEAYNTRIKKIKALFETVDSNALVEEMRIRNMEKALKALVSYYYRTLKTQRLSRQLLEQNAKKMASQISALRSMISTLRGDVADARNNVGIGDAVMRYEKQLRAQYKSVLARLQALAATITARMTPDQQSRKAELDRLVARMTKAQSDLDQVNRRIDAFLAVKRAHVLRVLSEEKAKLSGYQQQLAEYKQPSQSVVGGVAFENFQKVAEKVQQVLVKADVGVLDVVWVIKNLAKGRYEKRESLFMRHMELLKAKYREPRGVQ